MYNGIMAASAEVLPHKWSAACFQTRAAIENVFVTLGSGAEAERVWQTLLSSARAFVDLYDEEDTELTNADAQRLAPDLLRTAEEFRHLIESQGLEEQDPRVMIYDDFADRAELMALAASSEDWDCRRERLLQEAADGLPGLTEFEAEVARSTSAYAVCGRLFEEGGKGSSRATARLPKASRKAPAGIAR